MYLLKKQVLVLFMISFFSAAYCQTVVIDDFNGNNLNANWATQGTSFTISVVSGELKVNYKRDASSGQWDQFNVSFDNTNLMRYEIMLDIRSDVSFQLTLKPVYSDESNDWLQQNIVGDGSNHTVTFQAGQANMKTLNRIYIYFDGGTTAAKSGIAFIDNMRIVETSIFSGLNRAIGFAQLLHDNSLEGTEPGLYTPGSKQVYQEAINSAKNVANNSSSTQIEINQAITKLNDASYVFENLAIIDARVKLLEFVDDKATMETKNLFHNLKEISEFHFLFGMQDATGYGVGWSGDNDRSDVKDVCGSYPAVCSWSIKEVANGNSSDGEYYRMSKIFNLGGVNTVEWHMDNPYGGDFYWSNHPDPTKNVVLSILPGGEYHNLYKQKLDNIAFFARNLKGEKGQSIPIIYRPFHEHNGSWFWWGQPHCTPAQYKELWQFTVDYLRSKKVNNFLYAYSPDRFQTQANYLECYPGDEYVDILGFDDYWDLRYYEGLNIKSFLSQLEILTDLAESRQKVAALTETGYEGVRYKNWFTEVLLEPIRNNEKARRIAYAAVWRNANQSHHYAPYPGHESVKDFIDFYNDNETVFIDNIPEMYNRALSLDHPLSVKLLESIHETLLYPNPASRSITINCPEIISKLELYKVTGAKVMEENNLKVNSTSIDLGSFQEGVYLLKVNTLRGSSFLKKIIVVK